ncbi:hypothetical protein L6386_00195 [bacterium]|nr:hypothetical protein [bacterium]MCG2676976.1 hypothetical protein [bacterium]
MAEFTWEPYRKEERRRTGQILREEKYKCAFCRGTGQKPRGSKCSVCGGEGWVKVEPPAVICAYCKGRGEAPPRSNLTCTACRGKGVVNIKEPIEVCPQCRGSGRGQNGLPCLKCRGKGVISKG